MKINKYIKDKNNKYKVIIDDEEYILYDDTIAKYQLLFKSDISKDELDEIIKFNSELLSYYESIKYINKKLRTELEIREYLNKKGISNNIINKTIKRLYDNNFLNEDIYLKCYVSDQINLSNNGPKKIIKNLIKLGIKEDKIYVYLDGIDESIWYNKIKDYIDKKVKLNHNSSSYQLKSKIKIDLINLGYDKDMIENYLNCVKVDEKEIYDKEYEKAKRSLSNKYEGYELERKIKERLYRKGFKVNSYEE